MAKSVWNRRGVPEAWIMLDELYGDGILNLFKSQCVKAASVIKIACIAQNICPAVSVKSIDTMSGSALLLLAMAASFQVNQLFDAVLC